MDAFESWKAAAAHRQEMRIKTANAFQYLYLSLGQRAIKAWQEGVAYQQKVLVFHHAYMSKLLHRHNC